MIDLNRRLHDTRKPGTETPGEADRRRRAALMARRGTGFAQRHASGFLQPNEQVAVRVNPSGTSLSDLVSIKRSDPEIAERFRRMDQLHPAVQSIKDVNLSLVELEILDVIHRTCASVAGEPMPVSRATLAQRTGLTPHDAEAHLHALIASGHVRRVASFSGPARFKVNL
jgi:hypothetical protein